MDMRYSLDAVKHHCRQRFEAIGLLQIIYLSLGDFRMLRALDHCADTRQWRDRAMVRVTLSVTLSMSSFCMKRVGAWYILQFASIGVIAR